MFIEICGLIKYFGLVWVFDGFDFMVCEGEVYGFFGFNGVGKFMILCILLGLVKVDGGSVWLLGGDFWIDVVDLYCYIVYVLGDVILWLLLIGGEIIDLLVCM